jgi:transglutaminase-like putative cysteine protease
VDRRDFLRTAIASSLAALVRSSLADATANSFKPSPSDGWRAFEVTTRIGLDSADPATRIWLPLPAVEDGDWIRHMGDLWQGTATRIHMERDSDSGAQMLAARWETTDPSPVVEVTSRVATRNRAVDLSKRDSAMALDSATARRYTRATKLHPIDGIVRKTALEIMRDVHTDVGKARAIYDWIVVNTVRDPQVRGCGLGDIRSLLEVGDLRGKCADSNALYVGLARALGLLARDAYGIRVAESRFGCKSLGRSGDITKAQHCRAEVWLSGLGWVPVDAADVRKVILEERAGLTLADEVVVAARETLFGAWEMNWMAFNFAHDVHLPGSTGPTIPFLMYPQGENASGRFDRLDADHFRYRITAREVAV